MMQPFLQYSDESDYEKGSSSIKEIVLAHIKKISDLSCQEMTRGYFQEKPVKVGESFTVIKEYHPDLKIAYCNAIDFLVDLLYPKADDKFREFMDNKDNDSDDVRKDETVKKKRQIFKEINLFFERTNYFVSGDSGDE